MAHSCGPLLLQRVGIGMAHVATVRAVLALCEIGRGLDGPTRIAPTSDGLAAVQANPDGQHDGRRH